MMEFLNETHRRYVESGRCPAVLWTKAYCNGEAGHPEPHWSMHQVAPDEKKRDVWPENANLLISPTR